MSSTKSSPRDFSIFSLFTAGLAWLAFAPVASAYTKPVGANPKGNPIYTPGLHGKGLAVKYVRLIYALIHLKT